MCVIGSEQLWNHARWLLQMLQNKLHLDFDPSSFPWAGKLVLLENIGVDSNNEPKWTLINNEFLGNGLGNNFIVNYTILISKKNQ